ncbi:PREDICTED: cation/H(+) antiporter 15-like [Fragaria vesca subsp. vesca]
MAGAKHEMMLPVCVPLSALSSKGIWFNENPLDYELPATLFQITIFVVTSRLLYVLLKPLGQTKFTCNLLAGVILGPSLFATIPVMKEKLANQKDSPLWATMGIMGIIFSIFLTAIKLDVCMMKRTGLSLKIGAPGFSPGVAQALDDLNLMNSELGQLAMFSVLLVEIIQWLISTAQDIATKDNAIIGAAYLAKLFTVTVAALCCKISLRNSLLLGVMMNIRGIIEVVIFSRWRHTEVLDDQFYTQLLLSVLIMNMISTSLLHFTYRAHLRLGPSLKGPRIKNIQSVQRNYPFDILCCIHNEQTIRNLTSILEASNPTEESPICAYIIQAVELVGRAIPVLVPYKKKKKGKKCSRLNSLTHQLMQAFKNYSENSRGPVLIESFTMIAPYKLMHETICRLVDDNHVPLVILPFHDNPWICNTVTTAIRQFNKNMLRYSSSTVGILVERGFPGPVTMSHFSYNVAAFFIGGPDDREALALAARMLGNQNVAVTIYRIRIMHQGNYNEDEENEARLDDAMVDEFKLSSIGNDCLKWRDIEVEDTEQLMDAIMDSQGDYDLVMVGRRHADNSLRDEEMSEFVHYAELGMIGDMLASSDFCGGMVNVLVLQESTELSKNYGSTHGRDVSQNLGLN